MQTKINREIKVFVPIFAVIILLSIGLGYDLPEKIPEAFTLEGIATKWVDRVEFGSNTPFLSAITSYHIPIIELIIYVIFTFLQFHFYKLKDKQNIADFVYYTKIGLVAFIGVMMPFTTYWYAMKYISNIWYLVGPALAGFVTYLFIMLLVTGAIEKPKKRKLSSRAKKKLKAKSK